MSRAYARPGEETMQQLKAARYTSQPSVQAKAGFFIGGAF
ncbi:hypothetical protein PSAC2689_80028 [Paraburkholderia sacchari]